ncbi:MAG TPA: ATP-binding protein, partial [Polyangiaceae bacterium]
SPVVARRQAEKLAEERAFAFEVLDRGEPFVCLDADYTITFFNQAWADLAKRAPSELQGKNFWKVFPEVANEESAHWKSFHKCLETQEPVRAEVYYEPLDIHSQLSVFPTKNGGIAIFVRDINEEKRVERAKAELDRALQHTLEAEQAARRVADEANRTKDEFLATVSHELRTPLTAILGWTTILRAGDLEPAKVGKALETIERNARSQSQLIEDLLDLSRIVSGKLRLAVAPVDVHAVVEAAIDVMMPAAEAKGIRLTRVLDPQAMPIAGDAERLQQVVWNLIANAIKFTPRGGRVQVRLSKVDSQILIAVSDNGQGMTPDFIAHAFERFRQADGATTRSHGGLGLGLSIVKSLVELHGGTVEAVSEGLGKGSELRVKIPISPVMRLAVETPEPATVAPVFNDKLICPPGLEGAKVVVVDDEPDTVSLLTAILHHCKVVVFSANDAASALALVKEHRPAAIISDIGMPNEDGYAFIAKIRALPKDEGGRTPALALTAFARAEDRTRALLAGFTMHLAKPIEPTELLVTLASAIER